MPSVTLAQIRQYVLDRLDNSIEFTAPQINSAINEGLYRINLLTGYQQVTVSIITQAGLFIYNTPAGMLIPMRLDVEGIPLAPPISLRLLAREYRSWSTDTVSAMGQIARWSRIGLSQFIIHPLDDQGGQDMDLTGVEPMTPLVNDGDVATLDNQFIEALVIYAKIRSFAKEVGAAFDMVTKDYKQLQKQISTMSRWNEVRQPSFWLRKSQSEVIG